MRAQFENMQLLQEFKDYYLRLEHCCLKPDSKELVEKAVRVLHWEPSVPDEDSGAAVVMLENEQYAVFEEWQDYSGHG
jgi:hypothetical protein